MFGNRKKTLLSFSMVFTALICIKCTAVMASKASTYKKPIVDSDILVDIYVQDKAWGGRTLLADNHRRRRPRIIEVDMQGRIVWEYVLPRSLRQYNNPGFDVELLPNNNVLFVLPRKGIYEIDRNGQVIWSHLDKKVSHDADRLPNGNTLYVFGNEDRKRDAQVKEVNPAGEIVWAWYAKDEFDKPPYENIYDRGWTHTNAVIRMANGNTLISPRNFNCLVEVDRKGKVLRIIGEEYLERQHDPEILPNGNILVVNHQRPHEALEIDRRTEAIVWRFAIPERRMWPVRDADRLPNGNILITGATALIEITPDKQIVWRLKLKNVPFRSRKDAAALGFYKAQRTRR